MVTYKRNLWVKFQVLHNHYWFLPLFLIYQMVSNVVVTYKDYIQYTWHPSNTLLIHYKKWLTTISSVLPSFYLGFMRNQPLSDLVPVLHNHCWFWVVFVTYQIDWNVVIEYKYYIPYTCHPWNTILTHYNKQLTTISSVLLSLYHGNLQKKPLSEIASAT